MHLLGHQLGPPIIGLWIGRRGFIFGGFVRPVYRNRTGENNLLCIKAARKAGHFNRAAHIRIIIFPRRMSGGCMDRRKVEDHRTGRINLQVRQVTNVMLNVAHPVNGCLGRAQVNAEQRAHAFRFKAFQQMRPNKT